jgi:alpha-tubulin suppressor-like RCC1 family protein
MNITNLIISLQQRANTSTISTIDCMSLSKIIEKLKVGNITTVANTASLPSTLTTSGNMFYVTADEDLYYNVGATWKPLTRVDNLIYGWGSNGHGHIGDGTLVSSASPKVGGGFLTNWSVVDTYNEHSVGITSTGIAYAWGRNYFGELGDNTTSTRSSPVTVVGGITTWSQISTGRNHTIAITSAGRAYGWGRGNYGRLGNGSTTGTSSPVTVVGGITTWSKVTGGETHSLAVTSGGIAYAWGRNGNGQLGDNTVSSRTSPVTVVGGITNWSQISANKGDNSQHTLGIRASGQLYGWGINSNGQIGNNASGFGQNRSSPVLVSGGITTWSQGAGGRSHSLGLTSTGLTYAWGYNAQGQMGDGTTVSKSSPVTVVGGITNWSQIAGGAFHNLALTTAGVLYGWGSGGSGALGEVTVSNRSSPVSVVGGITSWTSIKSGTRTSLAIAAVSV